MKLALMRTAPGKEDHELPQLQRIIRVTSLRNCKLTAPRIKVHINASQSSSSRHISTSTVQRRLCESGLYGRIAAKKATTEEEQQEEETCLGQETLGMDIRPAKI